MMPLWKVIETLEEMSCNPDVYSAEAVYLAAKHLKNMQTFCQKAQTMKTNMTKQAMALCETTLEMQELAKEIYFYDT